MGEHARFLGGTSGKNMAENGKCPSPQGLRREFFQFVPETLEEVILHIF